MKRLYNKKWTKWQLIKENPILGILSNNEVCVNTYLKTNIYTGKTKSKFVEI